MKRPIMEHLGFQMTLPVALITSVPFLTKRANRVFGTSGNACGLKRAKEATEA
jgi:hypothetical protein